MPVPSRDMNHYAVLRWEDVGMYCTPEQIRQLNGVLTNIANGRRRRGRPPREYCVVSNKRPELYEEVWGMFLGEIHREHEDSRAAFRERLAQLNASMNRRMSEAHVVLDEVQEEDDTDFEEAVEEVSRPTQGEMHISEGGTITITDSDNNPRVRIGDISDDSEPMTFAEYANGLVNSGSSWYVSSSTGSRFGSVHPNAEQSMTAAWTAASSNTSR